MTTQARNISDSIFRPDRAAYWEENLTLSELQDLVYNLTIADPDLRGCDLLLTRDGVNEFYASIVRRGKDGNGGTHQPNEVLIFSGPSRTRQGCLRELLFGLEKEAHRRIAEHVEPSPVELAEKTVFDDTGCQNGISCERSLDRSVDKATYEDDSLTTQSLRAEPKNDVFSWVSSSMPPAFVKSGMSVDERLCAIERLLEQRR